MYELIQVTESAYYMDCPAKVGFYKTGENTVCLIDSGSDKEAGKKVKKLLEAQRWHLEAIYITHSHADHIGGCQFLQSQTGCAVYAPGPECAVTRFPVLEPAFLYGGYPMKELKNKFLMAKESDCMPLTQDILPAGLQLLQLPGHSYDMVGFRTDDDVVFLADALSSVETLEKYRIGFLYDVKGYLETLEKIKSMEASWFIPAHAGAVQNISALAQLNMDTTIQIAHQIAELLYTPKSFDVLLADVFNTYGLTMNFSQRVLIGSTVKSYLSYLKELGSVDYSFENNTMLWKKSE